MTDNENDRLEELFNELENISDKALMKDLGEIKGIEVSTGFRDQLWAKIAEVKDREAFWEGLIPRLSRPAWVFASISLIVALGVGIRGGQSLYNKEEHIDENGSELMLSEFSAPYSLNSIEAWVVKSTLSGSEE